MTTATSRRSSRLVRRASRAERIAAVMRRNDAMFGPLVLSPKRIVPLEEEAYAAIDPSALRAPYTSTRNSYLETCVMRRRAYAARVWLARRLARIAIHEGLAAAWRGSAREDFYKFLFWSDAVRQERAR